MEGEDWGKVDMRAGGGSQMPGGAKEGEEGKEWERVSGNEWGTGG